MDDLISMCVEYDCLAVAERHQFLGHHAISVLRGVLHIAVAAARQYVKCGTVSSLCSAHLGVLIATEHLGKNICGFADAVLKENKAVHAAYHAEKSRFIAAGKL